MSIKTDQTTLAEDYKTSDGSPAGFIKNLADGSFTFGNLGSGWTFLETIIVPAGPVQSLVTFSGLNGDVDFAYRLIFDIVNPRDLASLVFLLPNGVATPAESVTTFVNAVDGIQRELNSRLVMAARRAISGLTEDWHLFGDCEFWAKSGQQRQMQSWHAEVNLSTTGGFPRSGLRIHHGRWTDTTTNITSLGIAGGFSPTTFAAAGSQFSLYKVDRTP